MRSDMERLCSPATIMKLAREQGALQEIERLTFFKSLETFDHLRSEGLVRRDALLFINSIASIALPQEDCEYMDSRWHELLRQVVIEITEEEAIDREAMEAKRRAPSSSGMFALDDYGSGFANEGSLLELSPRFIKVDLTIIRGIDTDPDKQQIVQNIVAYAHPRSIQIIAEGVETAEELKRCWSWAWTACRAISLQSPPTSRPGSRPPHGRSLKTAIARTAADARPGAKTAREVLFIMVQVDLITGFLGAGKTTFLRRYVRYLVEQGHNVCILENDFGAVNVDAMLVQDLLGPPLRP